MAIKLFRSNEVGAPQLGSSGVGDLLTILRACLVEGFGSRTPVGWTMPYSDLPNKIACFKSVTGDTLRLDDSIDYRWASATGFASMTDLDTGVEQYPSPSQLGVDNHFRVFKRYDQSLSSDEWAVIADDNFFYFINFKTDGAQNYPSGFFFGEYVSANPSFTSNFILTGELTSKTSTSTSHSFYALYSNSVNYYARRNYQESVNPAKLRLSWETISWDNPNPFTGGLELELVKLRSDTSPFVRYGNLPNHWRIRGSSNLEYQGGENFTVDGRHYLILSYTSSAFAIEYEDNTG